MTAPSADRSNLWRAALIVAAVCFVYSPAIHGGWLWDDDTAITGNPLVQDPSGFFKIWFHSTNLDYFPLKASVEWLEWRIWGDDTTGYHLLNIVLHAVGALLFWRVLTRLGVRNGWIGGLVFALHPLAVESVAWISELKNTLSLPFLLLAFAAYLDFEESGQRGAWVRSVLLYLAAILCKSSVVMFPFFLLLFALWKRGRISGRDWIRSAPYFVISLILGLVTVGLQAPSGASGLGSGHLGFGERIVQAGWALGFYFSKLLLPAGLMPIYANGSSAPFLALGLLVAIFAWVIVRKPAGGRAILFGIGTSVLMLIPVLGLIPMSFSSIGPVSDHLAYLALLGVAGLAAAGADALGSKLQGGSRIVLALALVVSGVFALEGHAYARAFRDTETFWTYTLGKNPDAWIAHYNLGVIREGQGRRDDAVAEYEAAIRAKPDDGPAHSNLAVLLVAMGKAEQGIAEAKRTIALEPGFAMAQYNLGNAYLALGKPALAVGPYEEALRLKPDSLEAHANLGSALSILGRYADSAAQYRAAIALDPKAAQAYCSLARDEAALGDKASELSDYQAALRIDPNLSEADFAVGGLMAASGRWAEAVPYYEQGLRAAPASPVPEENFGVVLANLGRMAEAAAHFEKAIALDPGYAKAKQDLAQAQRILGASR